MRFRIGTTWDGHVVGEDEAVDLEISAGQSELTVRVSAPYHGDPCPDAPPGALDGLWNHEVVEVFLVGEGRPVPYIEIELGPHGHFLILRLSGIRNRIGRVDDARLLAQIDGARWTGELVVPSEWLPHPIVRSCAFAIHGVGAARRYLSEVPLPGEKPDLHRPSQFPPWPDRGR